MQQGEKIYVSDGSVVDGKIVIKKKLSVISKEELDAICEELRDYLLFIEGVEESSYDDSDDDRAGTYWDRIPFARYYEIVPEKNSDALLRIDGKIVGFVFTVEDGREVDKYPFLFDGSIEHYIIMGYSASHSSDYTYIKKAKLVKRGIDGTPEEARRLNFSQSKRYPQF